MTELLKEARDLIAALDQWNKDVEAIIGRIPNTGFQGAGDLLRQIDAALEAPPDSAMEVVRKIRETTWLPDSKYDPRPVVRFTLTDAEAASLIQPTVPREMLYELMGAGAAIMDTEHNFAKRAQREAESQDAIATKYGVKVGG